MAEEVVTYRSIGTCTTGIGTGKSGLGNAAKSLLESTGILGSSKSGLQTGRSSSIGSGKSNFGTDSYKEGFYTYVKLDCPHLTDALNEIITVDTSKSCVGCSTKGENWLCLTCSEVYCSRFVKDHMVMRDEHSTHPVKDTIHPVVVSFVDARVWCYFCDAYIDAPVLRPICQAVIISKHNKQISYKYD